MNSRHDVQEPPSAIKEHQVSAGTRLPPSNRWALMVSQLPGLWLAVGVAVAASMVGRRFPIVGAPVTGIVIGVTLATIIKPGVRLQGSGHGVIFRVGLGVVFDFVAQGEFGAGVAGVGGGEVLTQLCDGGGGPLCW